MNEILIAGLKSIGTVIATEAIKGLTDLASEYTQNLFKRIGSEDYIEEESYEVYDEIEEYASSKYIDESHNHKIQAIYFV